MITVTQFLTADSNDVLTGTQLDQVPLPGTFSVLAASTVNDTEITISLGQDTYIDAQPLPLRANGVPEAAEDYSQVTQSPGGVRPVIQINIVTAATVMIIIQFVPA